ncbi:MHYT domain-containing protein [Rhizohabitans arisaemae]|uniref:MHYT domain-containing protein n=1 Tax=Rhizohabitans arisaemae TaxID=2720610 RepID=UPI0024B0B253|nr:MHYT domain-containing protein [Rhizohabitans arisaemae]
MSTLGSLLGLLLTSRARGMRGGARLRWLIWGAICIGGTGIWVMHFIAMLGFSVDRVPIRYDVPVTVASAVVAIVVVGVGLVILTYGGGRRPALLVGGLIAGAGVASMHYLGMAALNMPGHVGYDPLLVIASCVIAVVASTVALWFTLRVRGLVWTVLAAMIMGVAISGMHYTGMSAMSVGIDESLGQPTGADSTDFLLPLIVGISVLTVGLLTTVLLTPSESELREEADLLDRIEARRRLAEQEVRPPAAGRPGPPADTRTGRPVREGRPGAHRQGATSARTSLFEPVDQTGPADQPKKTSDSR